MAFFAFFDSFPQFPVLPVLSFGSLDILPYLDLWSPLTREGRGFLPLWLVQAFKQPLLDSLGEAV
jgi:hypothetical protein